MWKQQAYTLEKSALDDSSAYISHTECCWVDDSSTNSRLSLWLIFWLWHSIFWLWHSTISSHKEKASFPQESLLSTVDKKNHVLNHSKNITEVQQGKTYDLHLVTVMSSRTRSFNVNCLFIYDSYSWLLSSFVDESSTSTHFEVLSGSIFLCIQ